MDEYNTSELKRFLKMTGCMLRNQLSTLIEESMKSYVQDLVSKYADPLRFKREQKRQQHGDDSYELTDEDILDGYLTGSSITTLATQGGSGSRPLFVFKMSTSGNEVIFLPGLESIELTVLGLVNIPSKLQSICQIDNDVVPLLGMQDEPLCSAQSVPELYKSAEVYKKTLATLINENLRQPLALKELYSPYSELLGIDTETYVYEWFHPYEVEQKRLGSRSARRRCLLSVRPGGAEEEGARTLLGGDCPWRTTRRMDRRSETRRRITRGQYRARMIRRRRRRSVLQQGDCPRDDARSFRCSEFVSRVLQCLFSRVGEKGSRRAPRPPERGGAQASWPFPP